MKSSYLPLSEYELRDLPKLDIPDASWSLKNGVLLVGVLHQEAVISQESHVNKDSGGQRRHSLPEHP